jgi:nickel/cobalt exporter
MLHDIHEAYRTFAVSDEPGAAPRQSVHTTTRPSARWDFTGDGDPGAQPGTTSGIGPWEPRFLRLIDLPAPTPWVVVTALLLAAGIGAVHALAPGHGKALGAAYLAGSRGRPRDAVLLGVAVAAMHTASVLALGLGLHSLAIGGRALDRVGPWLSVASALLVLGVGIGSLVRIARRRGVGPADTHDHPHSHLPPGVAPLSRRGLVLIGISGGLLPSQSAFLVLTTALFTGRTLFGLALVGAFSVGLAATLTALGLAVLRGRALAGRSAANRPRWSAALLTLPVVSAALITLGGLWLTVFAVRALP